MTINYSIYSNHNAVSRIYSRKRNVRPFGVIRHFPVRHSQVLQSPVTPRVFVTSDTYADYTGNSQEAERKLGGTDGEMDAGVVE